MDFLRAFAPDRPLIAIFVVLAESRLSHPLAPFPHHTGTVSLGPDFGPFRPDRSRAGMRRFRTVAGWAETGGAVDVERCAPLSKCNLPLPTMPEDANLLAAPSKMAESRTKLGGDR